MVDILVLEEKMHGMQSSECAELIRERLPDREVVLATSPSAERELIGNAEVIVGGRPPDDLPERAENLRLFACTYAGVSHLDLDAYREHDIAVTNASGVHGPNMSEYVIGWFLMLTRRFEIGLRQQARREWRHYQAMGELKGSRVCVVGLGSIGTAIVERLGGFDVETAGVRYTPEKGGPTDEVYGFDEIAEALAGVEYLALACPLTDTTDGLIGRTELNVLSHDAILVNVARGPVVQTDELVSALRGSKIYAAVLDVTDPEPLPEEHPLWTLSNAYITPHNSGHTPYYYERVADILARNMERVDETGSYDGLENRVV